MFLRVDVLRRATPTLNSPAVGLSHLGVIIVFLALIGYFNVVLRVSRERDGAFRQMNLPRASACRLLASVPRPDSFVAIAERGFFVYDWSDVHRTTASLIDAYEPMACPVRPVSLDELPESLRSHAASVRYSAGEFSDCEYFKATKYFDCVSGLQSD